MNRGLFRQIISSGNICKNYFKAYLLFCFLIRLCKILWYFYVLRSVIFLVFDLHHSRSVYYFTTMGTVVPGWSLLPLFFLFVFVPHFLSVLLLIWLLLCFFLVMVSLSSRVSRGSVYVFCFSNYTRNSVLVYSFLDLWMNYMLLNALILLLIFWKHMCITFFLLSVCYQVILVTLGKLCCTVGNHSLSLIYILHCKVFFFSATTLKVFIALFAFPITIDNFLVWYDLASFKNIIIIMCEIYIAPSRYINIFLWCFT